MVSLEIIQTSVQNCFQNRFSPNAAGEKVSPWLLPVENVCGVRMGRKLKREKVVGKLTATRPVWKETKWKSVEAWLPWNACPICELWDPDGFPPGTGRAARPGHSFRAAPTCARKVCPKSLLLGGSRLGGVPRVPRGGRGAPALREEQEECGRDSTMQCVPQTGVV